MQLAIIFGYKIMVQLLSHNKYHDFNKVDVRGWNVYHLCAMYDRLEIMDFLYQNPEYRIERAVDLKGNTMLHVASKYGRFQIVRYILEHSDMPKARFKVTIVKTRT